MSRPAAKRNPPSVAVALLAATCFLPSCSGGGTPPRAPASPTPMPAAGLTCSTTPIAAPGTYAQISSLGNIAGGTYASSTGGWTAIGLTLGPPAPSPSPTPPSTPSPSPAPSSTPVTVYRVYAGTFSLPAFVAAGTPIGATHGCFYLLATASGAPLAGAPADDAQAITLVPLPSPGDATLALNVLAQGRLTAFSVTGLGPSSGRGAFILDNGVRGTAAIASSQTATFAQARAIIESARR